MDRLFGAVKKRSLWTRKNGSQGMKADLNRELAVIFRHVSEAIVMQLGHDHERFLVLESVELCILPLHSDLPVRHNFYRYCQQPSISMNEMSASDTICRVNIYAGQQIFQEKSLIDLSTYRCGEAHPVSLAPYATCPPLHTGVPSPSVLCGHLSHVEMA